MVSVESKPLFRELTAEDPDPECTEIESLCMNCHTNGTTRLLLTRIPHYKNVVLMSFSCDACGYANNEIQPGGAFADMGVRWKLRVEERQDLNRQVVKSDYTCVRIPEVDLEIPAQSQKGEVTTVEGILRRAISGLLQDQESRRLDHGEAAKQIDAFVATLTELVEMRAGPFTVELEDASGNCFIENPVAPRRDPRCARTDFKRTAEQDHMLGIYTQQEAAESFAEVSRPMLAPCDPAEHSYARLENDELMTFNTNCPECDTPCDTRMKLTHIPHFKEVLIMATTCDACGHRSNEVKSGSGIEDKGVRIEVRVASKDDFSRDILKSETCSMEIPELDLEVGGRALGGRFTTAEGLLRATSQQLSEGAGVTGDAPSMNKETMDKFLSTLEEVLEGRRAVTIVLDDPAGNSYVQSLNDANPDLPDDGLKITRYVRTHEQNDELGLNDMRTEGYQAESV